MQIVSPMRLLLIAPCADGNDVGEAWSAHQWAQRLSERHDVTVLTYYKRGHVPPSVQLPKARVVEWHDLPIVDRAERFNSLLKPGYVAFYARCRRWIKAALRRGEQFDLAHQIIPLALRYPSPAVGFPMPYLLGPVGGGLDDPEGFHGDSDRAPWYVGLRNIDAWRLRHDPMMRRTYDDAACVLGIAPYVADALSSRRVRRFEVMSDTGIVELPEPVDRRGRSGPVRLLYVGRIVRTKGLRDAIRALALVPASKSVTLDVVGDGFDREPCVALAAELGVTDRVTFHGRVPRERVDDFYRSADVFVFPSYREPGGNVVWEAMGYGLPVVVADRGGPGESVDDASGFRIHPRTPDQFAADIAAALTRLVDEPDLRSQMGAAARTRVAGLALWDLKIERLEGWYAEIVAASQ